MAFLDPASLQWAVDAAAPGAEVIEVSGLRDGGSPWLIRPTAHRQERNLVLRVGTDQDPGALPTEVAALQLAAEHDIPASSPPTWTASHRWFWSNSSREAARSPETARQSASAPWVAPPPCCT